MPKAVAKEIISIQRRFFWGKREGDRFHPLVKWEIIQLPRKQGGLGVGDMVIKNAAMLFKWWWRFSDENDALWKEWYVLAII